MMIYRLEFSNLLYVYTHLLIFYLIYTVYIIFQLRLKCYLNLGLYIWPIPWRSTFIKGSSEAGLQIKYPLRIQNNTYVCYFSVYWNVVFCTFGYCFQQVSLFLKYYSSEGVLGWKEMGVITKYIVTSTYECKATNNTKQ